MKTSFLNLLAFVAFAGFPRLLLAQNTFDPTVTIHATDAMASETHSDPGTFTVQRTGPTNFALLVFYQLTGTASNGVDYEQLGSTVQIPAGALAASFTVKPIDDALVESSETVVATLTASPMACITCGYTIGSPGTATVVIAGNDPRGVNIYATDPDASEIHSAPNIDPPSNPAVFTVQRFGDLSEGIVVYYEISGTASNGVDYQKLPGQVSLPQGVSSADIVVRPIADGIVEGSETVVLTLLPTCPQCLFANPPCLPPQGTNCYPIGPDNQAVAYIRDGNTTNLPPAVRMLRPTNGEIFETHSDIGLVAFTQDPEDSYFVAVEFFEGSHSLGLGTFVPGRCAVCPNYALTWSNVPPGTYILTAKATDSQGAMGVSAPVQISVTGTNIPPGTNIPVVTIVATDGVAVEGPFCRSNWWWTTSWNGSNWNTAPASGDPHSPTWRTNNCSGTNTANFAVRRSGPTNSELTVYYTIGGTASNGVDFVGLPGRITIAAGRRSAGIEVVPIDDSIREHIETLVVGLQPPVTSNTAPSYVIGFPKRAAAIIIDNDQPRPPCMRLPDGLFHVCSPATNGHNFTLRASADLMDWTVLCTNSVTDGAIHFVDPDAPLLDRRFYQVIPDASPTSD